MMQNQEIVWVPQRIFDCPDDHKFALVVLNQSIHLPRDYVLSQWEKAQVTITVDGGTNHWIKYLGDRANDVLSGKCKKYLPTLVTGDMDSISQDLLNKLKSIKAKIIVTPDVMETDFTKSLRELKEYSIKNNIKLNGVHVVAETEGRLDHVIANINTLYKCDKFLNDLWVIQISSNSLTWLLKVGSHKIIIPKILLEKKVWCALIPFGDSNNRVSTTGLKWNLNNTCMKFGELISTSNTYSGQPEVTITTNAPLIWIMGIGPITRVNETD
ncbi:thiamin pyrophosphokinase 1 isoform X2 [Copidosoma floridanum]|uniref:thiamin pyrophosphokinase 1 isoform X2 n=1 Tax=Copidosoma floridanum TaxID=29053 RepID=UPI000C6FB703|nr:thiamin pyrophosphokinase 1 isoform X2 [Copidosoma floridanum]